MTVLQNQEERNGLTFYDAGEHGTFTWSSPKGAKRFEIAASGFTGSGPIHFLQLYGTDVARVDTTEGRVVLMSDMGGRQSEMELSVPQTVVDDILDTIDAWQPRW